MTAFPGIFHLSKAVGRFVHYEWAILKEPSNGWVIGGISSESKISTAWIPVSVTQAPNSMNGSGRDDNPEGSDTPDPMARNRTQKR